MKPQKGATAVYFISGECSLMNHTTDVIVQDVCVCVGTVIIILLPTYSWRHVIVMLLTGLATYTYTIS